MEIQVARLTESAPDVVEQLNVLIPQLKPAWAPVSVTSLSRVIESPTRVYVASCGGVIVAVALLVPHRHLPGLRFHVEDVVVDEPFRRRGVASRLLTFAMGDAPDDVISFDLRSHTVRRAAHALYLSLGFEAGDTTVFRRVVRERTQPEAHGARRICSAADWMACAAVAGVRTPRSASWIADQPASSISGNRASGG